MTKFTNFISSLVILVMGGLGFAGCTQPTTSTTSNPPSNLTAAATSTSTIVVRWTRDPADVGADTIIATDTFAGSKITPVIVLPTAVPDTMGILTGLDTGVTYTITVHSTEHVSSALLVTTNPPSGIRALSLDSATITVVWTRAQGDASADTVIATPVSGPPVRDTISSPGTKANIGELSEGVVYSISVHSTAGTTTILPWMTAEETMGLKIYEPRDTILTDPRALILAAHNTHSAPLTGLANADFVLDTVEDSTLNMLSLVSGKVYNGAWNDVKIDPNPYYVNGGIAANYRSTDYQAEQAVTPTANSYDIPDSAIYAVTGSRILIVTTADNHLALVEIVPDPVTAQLYSSDPVSNFKYITVNVSYQSSVNQPYAARGRTRSSGPAQRISAH